MAVLVVVAVAHLAFDLRGLGLWLVPFAIIYLLAYPFIRLVELMRRPRPRRPGYLALWLTSLAYVAVLMVPLYANLATHGATIAKAQADARALASAVNTYSAHMGSLPATLDDLSAAATNAKGETAGPFLSSMPRPPVGWSSYSYAYTTAGTFTISAHGEGTAVRVP